MRVFKETSNAWWRHSVVYHAFIDRFKGPVDADLSKLPVYAGGTIRGATSALPYVGELGADVFWLSPFQRGVSYHGYHQTALDSVDPHFGSDEDVRDLLGEADERNMHVICDIVPNHCSVEHPIFKKAMADRRSPYRDWFFFKPGTDSYTPFLQWGDMAKFNLDHPDAMNYVRQSCRKWLKMGMAGFRIDHVCGLSNGNLQQLLAPLRAEFPHTVYIGEAWLEGVDTDQQISTLRVGTPKQVRHWLTRPRSLYRNYAGILDGVLNFEGAELIEHFANSEDESERCKLRRSLMRQSESFPGDFTLPTMLDNHDMNRILFRLGNDKAKLRDAAALQFSLDQPVIIYYGTEVGMTQNQSSKGISHGDLFARQPMIWNESEQDRDLLGFYQELIAARRHPSPRRLAA